MSAQIVARGSGDIGAAQEQMRTKPGCTELQSDEREFAQIQRETEKRERTDRLSHETQEQQQLQQVQQRMQPSHAATTTTGAAGAVAALTRRICDSRIRNKDAISRTSTEVL